MQSNISKQTIRARIKELQKNTLTLDSNILQKEFNKNIKKTLENSEYFIKSNILLAYYPMQYEASCIDLLYTSLIMGKRVALPKINNDVITFHFCDSNNLQNLKKNTYGIYEPITDAIDFNLIMKEKKINITILVPGLAFTKKGKRLGRGKGYYDKFLCSILELQKKYPKVSITFIGLCFSFQIVNEIPMEEHDIKMNYVVTEKELHYEENTNIQ